MKIVIETIPHASQRYDTVGDWWFDPDGSLQIRVSAASDERYEQLVAVHELVEVLQCMNDGVTQKQVDEFDMAYTGDGEPGEQPEAPYHVQHMNAYAIEIALASMLRVDWKKYDSSVSNA